MKGDGGASRRWLLTLGEEGELEDDVEDFGGQTREGRRRLDLLRRHDEKPIGWYEEEELAGSNSLLMEKKRVSGKCDGKAKKRTGYSQSCSRQSYGSI
jgi:hypothetical protein